MPAAADESSSQWLNLELGIDMIDLAYYTVAWRWANDGGASKSP